MAEEKNEHAQALAALGASKGGLARAASMTAEERSNVAQRAALARWAQPPRATHSGELNIGGVRIPCAVLADGTRVLTQWGFYRAIGRSGRPAGGRGSDVEKMAPFLDLDNLKPYVSEELAASTKPIVFLLPSGIKAYGYRAEVLPKVCDVYLEAREADVLLKTQLKFAKVCEVLVRGLAQVGIVALVDEATGYQADRARDALAKILERFIAKELRPWVSTFPPEFYEQMFRLRGWRFDPMSLKRPILAGNLTDNVVYKRLAPGVRDELRRMVPRKDNGKLATALHRGLTEDFGHPKLREHLIGVTALMKASQNWTSFKDLLDRVYPKYGDTLRLLPVMPMLPQAIEVDDE
jgi:hypothetical protein